MKRLLLFSGLVLLLLASLPGRRTLAAGSSGYTFKKIAEQSGDFTSLQPPYVVNNDGIVAFRGTRGGVSGIYKGDGASVSLLMAATYPHGNPEGLKITNSGLVTWQQSTAAGESYGDVIGTSDGQQLRTLATGLGNYDVNDAGRVVGSYLRQTYLGEDPPDVFSTAWSVRAATKSDGGSETVIEEFSGTYRYSSRTNTYSGDHPSTGVGPLAINAAGEVAYLVWTGSVLANGLIRSNAGGSLVNIGGAALRPVLAVDINDGGTVAFLAKQPALSGVGNTVAMASPGGAAQVLADTSGPFSSFGDRGISITDSDRVVFSAWTDAGKFGIFQGPDPAQDKIIQVGDPLDGSTVTWLDVSRHGVSDDGKIVIWAQLANGRRGIYLATATTRRPVIIVPGIGGSALDDNPNGNSEDGSTTNLLTEEWPSDVLGFGIGTPEHLQFDASGNPLPGVSASLRATGLLKTPGHDLWDLVHFLENNGYQRGQSLFIYAYDFRYSVARNALGLRDFIATVAQNHPKVDLVCHSMGGLAAKAALLDGSTAEKVERLVMLGTPHLGSAAGFQALRYGYDMGDSMISPLKSKRAVHNMPGGL